MLQSRQNWHSPNGKLEQITEKWGDKIPDYLFYSIDPLESVSTSEVVAQCFKGIEPGFGDVEVHESHSTNPNGPAVLLRVRNATAMPMQLMLSGVNCPLIQVGYGATTLFNKPDPRCISFVEKGQPTTAR